MPRKLIATAVATAFLSVVPATALATSTGVPGQPNQDCESLGTLPHGFTTTAFQNTATQMYAGAGPGSAHANSLNAVSQYDMACFQQFSHQH